MPRRATVAILVLTAALIVSAVALAAKPRLPGKFAGGGGGSPVTFSLDKKGRATAASFAFTCKNANGIATAKTDKKHKPAGKVTSKGKITITYLAKGGGKVGTVKATIKAAFTSKTHAKGTTSISGGNCKSPSKGNFTADAR